MRSDDLSVRYRSPGELVPYERNARTHSAEQLAKIEASLQEFGFTNPILLGANDVVLAGHGRLEAAKSLRLDRIPTISLAHLTTEQQRAYILADNRLALDAGWDDELLEEELRALQGSGFQIGVIGFTASELEDLLEMAVEDDGSAVDAAVPAVPAKPTARLGDIWILGAHRLACGDCRDETLLRGLLQDLKAECIWTDPPYNVAYGDKATWLNKRLGGNHSTASIQNDDLSDIEFVAFLTGAFTAAREVLADGGAIYVAHSETEGIAFRSAFASVGFKLSSCLIWRKNSLVLGRSDYHWQHEPILYGWKPGAAHRWHGARDKTSMLEWQVAAVSQVDDDAWQITLGEQTFVIRGQNMRVERVYGTVIDEDRPSRSDLHPTMKPIRLIERCLKNSARLGDIVFDPFGGAGSTLMACERLGMRARLTELEPGYVDVTILRWQEHYNGTAILEGSGSRSWVDVKAERGP